MGGRKGLRGRHEGSRRGILGRQEERPTQYEASQEEKLRAAWLRDLQTGRFCRYHLMSRHLRDELSRDGGLEARRVGKFGLQSSRGASLREPRAARHSGGLLRSVAKNIAYTNLPRSTTHLWQLSAARGRHREAGRAQ